MSILGKRATKNGLEDLDCPAELLAMINDVPQSTAKDIVTKTLEAAYGVDGPELVAQYLIITVAGGNKSIANAIRVLNEMTGADVISRCSDLIVTEFLSPMAGKKGPGGGAPPLRLAGFKTGVTIRDNHTCRVTGRVDRQKFAESVLPTQGNESLGRLERAHIAPWAALSNKTVASFVKNFTGGVIDEEVLKTIDTVANGMLLQHDAHRDYDDYLWSVEEQNGTFKVISRNRGPNLSFKDEDKELVFDNLPGKNYGKPDGKFFKLHQVVGKLLQGTGQGRVALMQEV